jgi:hypothetical protein
MTPQEILTRAADHLERVGLYKGDFYDSRDKASQYAERAITTEVISEVQDKPCCALGAIYAVTPAMPRERIDILGDVERASRLLARHISPEYDTADIPTWNDWTNRTKEDVVAALRAAAQLEEENSK